MAAFVPVDDTKTLLYLRFYQSFMKLPGLCHLIMTLAESFNLIVAHQDRSVVETQLPKADGMGTGELCASIS